MIAFNDAGFLKEKAFDKSANAAIEKAAQLAMEGEPTAAKRIKPGHVLLALWESLITDKDWRMALEKGLARNIQLDGIPKLLRVSVGDPDSHETLFELKRDEFDQHLLRAFVTMDVVKDKHGNIVWEALGLPVGIVLLTISILQNLSPDEKNAFSNRQIFDWNAAAEEFMRLLILSEIGEHAEVETPPSLFSDEGALFLDYFDDGAILALEKSRNRAGGLGHNLIRAPHLLLGLLECPDGITEEVVRLHSGAGMGPQKVCESLIRAINIGPASQNRQLELTQYHLSETLQDILRLAWLKARQHGKDSISEAFLLQALLESEKDGLISRVLSSHEIRLNLDEILEKVERLILHPRSTESIMPLLIPIETAKSQDLTYLARTVGIEASVGQDDLLEQVKRALHKRYNNHVIITGQSGVGKTQLVRNLCRHAALGEIQFLKRKKIIWVDCDGIPTDESRSRFDKIVGAVKGRNDVIICLDHFENILRFSSQRESHNRPIIRASLSAHDIHLIAIMEDRYFNELLGNDYLLLEMFTRVEVPEVSLKDTIAILKNITAPNFERLYGVTIEDQAIKRAAYASREFIMSERLPAKAIRTLREACENVCYDKETGRLNATKPALTEAAVVTAVSLRTGIDAETIAGTGTNVDYQELLSKQIVGQEEAVAAVADRLKRIKAGDVEEGKPAAVFLFAGLTGTGKTELGKAIAKVYSASGKLLIYSMSRFTDEHSITGILGVPPGYVGYESGGRLINDLNADPFGVVMFDEADKADPTIWEAMLSLFDEGWLEDQRNVKAYGNRAIFILTSNAGQELIRRSYKTVPLDKLKKMVGQQLIEHTNKRGKQPFSPEFLGRFTDIAVFNPLSLEAMKEIARKQVRTLIDQWEIKRGKQVIVDDEVIDFVAKRSYRENEEANGTKGGRIVAKHIGTFIRLKAIDLMIASKEDFAHVLSFRISMKESNDTEAFIEKVFNPVSEGVTSHA